MSDRREGIINSTVAFFGAVPVDPAVEEENHQRVLDLRADTHDGLVVLYHSLGDPSWRVRKAAQAAVQQFLKDPQLVPTLIAGLGAQDNAGLRNASAEVLVNLGEAAVPGLAAALTTADLDQRKFVVEVLGTIGTPSALEHLLQALDQSDSNVRSAVVDALGQIGGDGVTRLLHARLKSSGSDLQLCVYLLDALARCGARLPAQELMGYLQHRQLNRFVYPLLGLSKDAQAITPLISAVQTGSRSVRRVVLPALACLVRELGRGVTAELAPRLMDGAVHGALREALGDEDEAVVRAALYLCGASGDAALAPHLLEVGVARALVQAALESVASLGTPAVAPLLGSIDKTDVQSALLFLDAIEAAGDRKAVPALLDAMQTTNAHLAGAAVRVLGRLGDASTIEPLMELARTRDEMEITRQVVFALGHLGQREGDDVARAMHRAISAGDVQPGWLSVLGLLRRDDDVEVIASACKHLDPDVRRAALEAAQAFGSRLPEATVRAALQDESGRVRQAAARVASAYRGEPIVSALLQATHDFDPWVMAEAARSLGTLGVARAAPALQQLATSPATPVAIAALHALARLDGTDMEATVRRAMQHNDSEVVREALHVASRLPRSVAYEVFSGALLHRAWDVRWTAAEQLIALGLGVDAALLQRCVNEETEPLVRDKLMHLTPGRGAIR